MANRKLDEVMELLNKVKERQDKYEKDYLKKDYDTASCNYFAGEKEKMEKHQELMKLSNIIDSIKVEVGQLAEMVEKQEQYLDDLEQEWPTCGACAKSGALQGSWWRIAVGENI